MPKVVIQKSSPIAFASTPFVVYDHDVINGVYYIKYRANITVIDAKTALSNTYEIRITREPPYANRPNMFKNVPIVSSQAFKNTISGYDDKRAGVFKKKTQLIKKIPILYQDMLRGFVEFTMKNTGSQDLFATLTQTNQNVPLSGQVLTFNSDPLVRLYAIPRADFVIGDATVFRNKTRIAITPKDKRITRFEVRVSNTVDNKQVPDVTSKVSSVAVSNDGVARIDITDTGDFKKTIKINPVSFYKNVSSSAYKEIVLNPGLVYNNQLILYPINNEGSSASFKIIAIPDQVIYMRLLRKNLTKLDRNFVVVSERSINDANLIMTDRSKQPYDTYQYKIELEFRNGAKVQAAAAYTLEPKLLSTSLEFGVREIERIDSDLPTARRYSAEIKYNNTSTTQNLLGELKTLGIDNIFPNEIKNLSTQLDPITAVIVSKINVSSCIEEFVGLFKPGEIIIDLPDSSPSVLIFEAVLKPASETIEDIASSRDFYTPGNVNTIGDPMIASRALGLTTFAKRENFTQKFFNASALYYGTLQYGKSFSSNRAGIASGRTGNFRSIIAYPSINTPQMNFVSVKQRPADKIITWNATNLDVVENFLVYDASDSKNIKLISNSIADSNRLDFSLPIPKNVSKVLIVANIIGEGKTSIEANV